MNSANQLGIAIGTTIKWCGAKVPPSCTEYDSGKAVFSCVVLPAVKHKRLHHDQSTRFRLVCCIWVVACNRLRLEVVPVMKQHPVILV